MSELANNVAQGLEESEIPVTLSAVVTADSIGYPRRIVEHDGENHDGEHKNFDEAYDYACDLFGVDEVNVTEEENYIWFKKQ